MCIVLLTTSHPDYALIVIDNRDEFILRPTSRPHWWKPEPEAPTPEDRQEILSSRDLQRAERGTWLGVTKAGHFAVLTNYRETDTADAQHPVHGVRSRGGMVTAWLTASPNEDLRSFVERMLKDGGTHGVGGFSLICGKLRRNKDSPADPAARTLEPLAIISNRSDTAAEVPYVAGQRGEVYGLSNTCFDDPLVWPKLEDGKFALRQTVEAAVARSAPEDELLADLFAILDADTLPRDDAMSFEEYIGVLKQSIFIPPIGDEDHRRDMDHARRRGSASVTGAPHADHLSPEATAELRGEERPDAQPMGFMTGMYGTQRQTAILVDWDGNVRYTERALYDSNGRPIERGQGDVTHRFKVEGWGS
ncbi:uncharacterized protein E0L32_001212 [Thyridium curvatum]|uniref:Uncharacterized protein n=1 Tax=Thyridium curvatum TaxID=1093900 RepID=A0A507AIL0_9PEZI|nr:uncharacterized protein E0L32_001212 [Thyridium curvatum]TPX10015.1 hypothetical protein E0L32_001212 [Thyridium curvatum]